MTVYSDIMTFSSIRDYIKSSPLGKIFIILFACGLCVLTLWYSNWMVRDLETEEYNKMEIWAEATSLIAADTLEESQIIDFLLKIVQDNNTIPIIVVNEFDSVISTRNLPLSFHKESPIDIEKFKADSKCIDVPVAGSFQHLYYGDSTVITRLSYFPVVEIALVSLFIIVAYMIYRNHRRSRENKVWIGLARETAHQLGTPITALLGWTDLLESGDIDNLTAATEIHKDAERLKNIANRFSKIGSKPEMFLLPLDETIASSVAYLNSRFPQRVNIEFIPSDNIITLHNPILIGWALENICRNAVDAIEGNGHIVIRSFQDNGHSIIEVTDNGKGMSRNTARQIFNAGFTTKKRGWGIGLTLTRRIISEYHHGRIAVAYSEINKGTTIRITL